MNVSYRWIRTVAPGIELSPAEAMHRLALRGAPVEEATALGEGLADVVVAQVIEAVKHPNADRLTLCRVAGPEGEVQVVCGAPHVKEGGFYPFAPVGAVLPGDFRIERRKIRGEQSQGMLCSERELGLGPDHDGIMLLEGDFEVGEPLAHALGLDDVRFDVEVTPNRGDLLSHVGIARELHPDGEGGIRLPELPGAKALEPAFVKDDTEAASGGVHIRIDDPHLCPRYLGAVIRGVSVGPSPEWLAGPLRAAGARPINNVVDATNYVLLELGQPLHAFDLALLEGSRIVVRTAAEGETLTTLDGEERKVTPEMLMICDGMRPVAVAGVMGGANSEVSDASTDILLECALFEPKQVRATRRSLGMSTDASYRFERGVDPETMETAMLRCASLILAAAGGTLDRDIIDVCPSNWVPPIVTLRPSRVERLLGVAFEPLQIEDLLAPLGYVVTGSGDDRMQIRVPGHRSYDTLREVDLIEEIARTHGYDAFPEELAPYRPGTVPDHPLFQLEDELRRALVAEGLSEAQTPALGPERDGDVALLNPMSAQESHLRRDRLSGLLTHVERNLARGVRHVRLFELGTAFAPVPGEAPAESSRVAAVLTGARAPAHWSGPAEHYDVYDAAALLERIGRATAPDAAVVPASEPAAPFAAGLAYELRAGDEVLGRGGVVAPELLDLPPWGGDVVGLEVTLPDEPAPRSPVTARDLPNLPGSDRDVALLVPTGLPAGDVLASIERGGGELLESVEVFDLYEGGDLPHGMRSVAFRLRFRAGDRTLTDDEVGAAFEQVVARVKEETGVQPRG